MIKNFEYKLYRNKKKAKKLSDELFVFNRIHNHCIALHKRYYSLFGKSLSKYALQKHLTKRKKRGLFDCLNNGYSQGNQDVTDRIDKTYKAFFKWTKTKKGTRKSPPKFRPFRKAKSFTLKQSGWKLDEKNSKIKIGKVWYKYHNSRNIEGTAKTITIKRDNLGDWYIYIICESKNGFKSKKDVPMTGKSAGFDFGLNTFLKSSDNEDYFSPEFLKHALNELKQKSRALSTKSQGSKNRVKAKKSLARVHKRVSNKRRDSHNKLVLELLRKYDHLFFEDLNIKSMQMLWGRKVSDYSFSNFLRTLENKAPEHGKKVTKIDRFSPSSKKCSRCENIKESLKLNERVYKCDCGLVMDRDLNASINILIEGASSIGIDIVRPSTLANVV